MLKNYITVIPLIHDWDWTADFQKQTALELRKQGAEVIAFETHKRPVNIKRLIIKGQGIYRKKGNIHFIRPFHVIPFERFQLIYRLNKYISVVLLIAWLKMKFSRNKKIILWLFHPENLWIYKIFKKLLSNNFISVFDAVDFFASGENKIKYKVLEEELIKSVDIVTSISTLLANYLKNYRKDVHVVPQGFRIKDFAKPQKPNVIKRKKPVIGFVGGINNRLDYDLLTTLVGKNPRWDFVFWGPIQKKFINNYYQKKINKLLSLPNVTWGESPDKKEIPGIIKQFDVCSIPYDIRLEFNKYTYPMKIFEYFYEGKPVLTTPIAELRKFKGLVYQAADSKSWEAVINKLIKNTWPDSKIKMQQTLCMENTWRKKIEAITTYILNFDNSKS